MKFLALVLLAPVLCSYFVETLAGTRTRVNDGDGPPGIATSYGLFAFTIHSNGTSYFYTRLSNILRKMDPAGFTTTIWDFSSQISSVDCQALLIDEKNNFIYMSYLDLNIIVRTTTSGGPFTQISGSLSWPTSGSTDGFFPNNLLWAPGAMVFFGGNENIIIIADSKNFLLRKLNVTSGYLSTVAGQVGIANPAAYADGQGTAAIFSSYVKGLTNDSMGNVYWIESQGSGSGHVRKMNTTAYVSTFFTSVFNGDFFGCIIDVFGNIYGADHQSQNIRFFNLTAPYSTSIVPNSFSAPKSVNCVKIDRSGSLIYTDDNENMWKISAGTFAKNLFALGGPRSGIDGVGLQATFNLNSALSGIDVDSLGNIYTTDYGFNKIRIISPTGWVSTLAGTGAGGISNGQGSVATFGSPITLALDTSNQLLYVADSSGGKPWRNVYTSTTVVSTIGSYSGVLYQACDTLGNVYFSYDAGISVNKLSFTGTLTTPWVGSSTSGSADGTGTAATFGRIYAITMGKDGYIYIMTSGSLQIRKVSLAGVVTTVVPSVPLTNYGKLAVDSTGIIYLHQQDCQLWKINQTTLIMSAILGTNCHTICDLVDGGVSTARFGPNLALAVAFDDTLVIGDNSCNRIRTLKWTCAAGARTVSFGICANCAAGTSSTVGGLCTNCTAGMTALAGGLCMNCIAGSSSISGGLCTNCTAGMTALSGGLCANISAPSVYLSFDSRIDAATTDTFTISPSTTFTAMTALASVVSTESLNLNLISTLSTSSRPSPFFSLPSPDTFSGTRFVLQSFWADNSCLESPSVIYFFNVSTNRDGYTSEVQSYVQPPDFLFFDQALPFYAACGEVSSKIPHSRCCLSLTHPGAIGFKSTILQTLTSGDSSALRYAVPASANLQTYCSIVGNGKNPLFGYSELLIHDKECAQGLRCSETSLLIYDSLDCSKTSSFDVMILLTTESQIFYSEKIGWISIRSRSNFEGTSSAAWIKFIPSATFTATASDPLGATSLLFSVMTMAAFTFCTLYYLRRYQISRILLPLVVAASQFLWLIHVALVVLDTYILFPTPRFAFVVRSISYILGNLASLNSVLITAYILVRSFTSGAQKMYIFTYTSLILLHCALAGSYYVIYGVYIGNVFIVTLFNEWIHAAVFWTLFMLIFNSIPVFYVFTRIVWRSSNKEIGWLRLRTIIRHDIWVSFLLVGNVCNFLLWCVLQIVLNYFSTVLQNDKTALAFNAIVKVNF